MINVTNLCVKFKNKIIFNNDNYVFLDQGLYILKGESGVGKTTLLRAICNKCKYEGTITIDNQIYEKNDLCVSKKAVALFDKDLFFENKTLKENVNYFVTLDEEKNKLLCDYLKKYSLYMMLNNKMKTLSRGQRDLVKLIIGIISDCKYVLYDEALASLDPENRKNMLEDLKLISKSRCIIVVSHDDFALEYADKVYDFSSKNKEKQKVYIKEKHKHKLSFTFYSFVCLVLSIIAAFLCYNNMYNLDEFYYENNLKQYNDNVLRLRVNDFPNKETFATYVDCCDDIGAYAYSPKDFMITDLNLTIFNDVSLLKIDVSYLNRNQKKVFVNFEDGIDLKEDEVLISSTIKDYIDVSLQKYGLTRLSYKDVVFNSNYKIKGVYDKDDVSIKVGKNSLFFNEEVKTPIKVIKGRPENCENNNKVYYFSSDILMKMNNIISKQNEYYIDSEETLFDNIEFINEHNVVYVNKGFGTADQEKLYNDLTSVKLNDNFKKLNFKVHYYRSYESDNFKLLEGTMPKKSNEYIMSSVYKEIFQDKFNPATSAISASGYYEDSNDTLIMDYDEYYVYQPLYYRLLNYGLEYIYIGCVNADKVKNELSSLYNVDAIRQNNIDAISQSNGITYNQIYNKEKKKIDKIIIFAIALPSIIVICSYLYNMVFKKKKYQLELFNKKYFDDIYKDETGQLFKTVNLTYYTCQLVCLIIYLILNVSYYFLKKGYFKIYFTEIIFLVICILIGAILVNIVNLIMKLLFKKYLKNLNQN